MYEFSVVASNAVGDSVASVPTPLVSATSSAAPGAPTKVEGTQTSIAVQWVAPINNGGSPVTAYQVLVDKSDGFGFLVLGTTASASILTYNVTDLVSGSDYYF